MIRASTLRALRAVAKTPQFTLLVAEHQKDAPADDQRTDTLTWTAALAALLDTLSKIERNLDLAAVKRDAP